MKHENEPEGLPVCNFCDKEYDPYDKHICAGNMILPREKLDASYLGEDGSTVGRCVPGDFIVDEVCDYQYSETFKADPFGKKDITDTRFRHFVCCGALYTPGAECGCAEGQKRLELRDALAQANRESGRGLAERIDDPPEEFVKAVNFGLNASALSTQPGGDHYRKLPIQPVEYIIANGIGFLAGNVIKYASRYKDKGGADDIRKIKHYCDLILEFEYKEKS